MRQNLHTHTTFCDGKNTPLEMVQAALAQGLDSLGFSGHSPLPGTDWCMNQSTVPEYRREILELREQYKGELEIFLGLEQDILSPLPDQPYDYLIGSVHSVLRGEEMVYVDESRESFLQGIQSWFGGDPLAFAEEYYRQVGTVAQKTGCQIVGHLDLICKFNQGDQILDTSHPRYQKAVLGALEELSSRNVILEINTGAMSRGYRTQPYPAPWILKAAREMKFPICITSDAHSTEHLTFAFDQAAQMAGSCGYQETMYLTKQGFIPERLQTF